MTLGQAHAIVAASDTAKVPHFRQADWDSVVGIAQALVARNGVAAGAEPLEGVVVDDEGDEESTP